MSIEDLRHCYPAVGWVETFGPEHAIAPSIGLAASAFRGYGRAVIFLGSTAEDGIETRADSDSDTAAALVDQLRVLRTEPAREALRVLAPCKGMHRGCP